MRIAFRVDASLQIGSGHVVRCMTLAAELREAGAEILFVCRDLSGHMAHVLDEHGFSVALLSAPSVESKTVAGNPHRHWLKVAYEDDARETVQVLAGHDPWDWLVVDHYALDVAWEKIVADHVQRITVIDDLADREHVCDLLLDQNYYRNADRRYLRLVSSACRQLLGPGYALLRGEFTEARRRLGKRPDRVARILVFFGGVDLGNITGRVLASLQELNLRDVRVDVVIGQSNPHRASIESQCSRSGNMQLHVQVANMAEMTAAADLCIGAGGTATWERCCLGTPTLAWPIAENQKRLLFDCATDGLVYVPDFDDPDKQEISLHIQALIQNPRLRRHLSRNGMQTVDGHGARRVAKLLLAPRVELRPVDAEDMHNIYVWRNDIRVRRYSRDSSEIKPEQHERWFNSVLNNSNVRLFIGSADNEAVGVVRLDMSHDEAEISLYLVPGKQGHGYGGALVESAENWLRSEQPAVSHVVAEVLADNNASNRLFNACGYVMDTMKYRKRIDR